MPKDNQSFFSEKRIWSKVKDELLATYLEPYFTKMMSASNRVLYIDGFAGKGRFDDGKDGSPLIALASLERSVAVSRRARSSAFGHQVRMCFIDKNHASHLTANLSAGSTGICQIIDGKFENNIAQVLLDAKGAHFDSVFLYIDPYGIKALDMPLFNSLLQAFPKAELLVNFNSFGFVREACRVKKIVFRENEVDVLADLEEFDRSIMDSIEGMNLIAGGTYWQQIINEYQVGTIDCYQAEKQIAEQYKLGLQQSYAYVLDMPIRLRAGNHPKYRMIYATNHPDGCVLMGDNIAKRTEYLVVDIQQSGQHSLFTQTPDNEYIDEAILKQKVLDTFGGAQGWIRLRDFIARFYTGQGVLCGLPGLASGRNGSALKSLAAEGAIEVSREPALSPTGRTSMFWSESDNKKVWIRKN